MTASDLEKATAITQLIASYGGPTCAYLTTVKIIAQALTAERAATIEACAKVADRRADGFRYEGARSAARLIASGIRALAGTDQAKTEKGTS